MAGRVEAAQVAGLQPAVHDGLGGQLRLVEVVRHNGLAAHRHFADAVGVGRDDAHFHPRQRLADGVGPEGVEVVEGDGGAGFGEAVAVGDRDAEVVEKLQGGRLGEGAAHKQRPQLAPESLMHAAQQQAAERKPGPLARQAAVEGDEAIEDEPAVPRQLGKARAQTALQVLEHHRNQTHVSDFVAGEGVADVLRPQGAQVHHRRAAGEGADEAHHEVNGVVGGQNAQVAHPRPEGVERSERHALLEVILVRQHAALGLPAGAGGIDDRGRVGAVARDKVRLAARPALLPAARLP